MDILGRLEVCPLYLDNQLSYHPTPSNTSFISKDIELYALSSIRFSSDNDEETVLEHLYKIGLFHAKHGKPRDAIYYFDKVLKVMPTHEGSLVNKGNALGKLGRYEEAILTYDSILRERPDHIISLLNKVLALQYNQRYDEAISNYDKVL